MILCPQGHYYAAAHAAQPVLLNRADWRISPVGSLP